MTPTLLITGFEAFGGDDFNPSGAIARAFHGSVLPNGARIHGKVLPVSGPAAWTKVSRIVQRIRPHWIIATGVSGRAELSIESTAWNEDDFRIPDNAGCQPRRLPILSRGPGQLQTGLDFGPWISGGLGNRLPVRSSADPGRFVCNHLYYRLLHLTRKKAHCAHRRTLFVHLPGTPEMRRGPSDVRFFHPLDDVQKVILTILGEIALS